MTAMPIDLNRSFGLRALAGTALLVVALGLSGVCIPAGTVERAGPAQARHTNRLIDSNDPYLLLHAHNPVDWYPWGAEGYGPDT